MKQKILFLICLLSFAFAEAQTPQKNGSHWRIVLERKDGKNVPFLLQQREEDDKTVLYVINASERIRITDVTKKGDSLLFSMPAFESSFRVKLLNNGNLSGIYIKGTSGSTQYWRLWGYANKMQRFDTPAKIARRNISGKWDIDITRANGTIRKAIAVFEQEGNTVTGSILTPSGDYRYLDGAVTGDSLFLSSFDGDNIRLFEAKIDNENHISDGVFYNGYSGKETWIARKNNDVSLPEVNDPTRLREGETELDFKFNDLQGVPVSISDDRYKNKVVVVQIMGSWCANCLDETKFLSEYYNSNKSNGVEIIALAYEFTTDTERSVKSVSKFQKLFDVQYPMLITGAAAGDENKTEKTLPQLTTIRSFPTTIFIGKDGKVKEINTNFYGPASGEYFIASKNKFYETVEKLLKE